MPVSRHALFLTRSTTARLALLLAGCVTGVLSAGCLPGGIIAPLPIPHNDRPAVHGLLYEDGLPVEGVTVRAAGFDNGSSSGPATCDAYQAEATTNHRGEFEIRGDKDLITIWWDAGDTGPNSLAVCELEAAESAAWQTWFQRLDFPPWLPSEIDLTCTLQNDRTVLRCSGIENEET